jgi:hypothetical protein
MVIEGLSGEEKRKTRSGRVRERVKIKRRICRSDWIDRSQLEGWGEEGGERREREKIAAAQLGWKERNVG